jgi:hypothetical protein
MSADALIRLVLLKEDADEPETGRKIRSLLVPKEYTRLDGMIDVMFTAAKDVESAVESASEEEEAPQELLSSKVKGVWQFTDYTQLQAKRDEAIAALGRREDANLIKKTRALYWHPSKNVRAACTISKRYTRSPSAPYWYAYHPQWDEFLAEGSRSFVIFGCMDRKEAFAVPLNVMRSCLEALNVSEKEEGGHYWHIHLQESEDGNVSIILPKQKSLLSLRPYTIRL